MCVDYQGSDQNVLNTKGSLAVALLAFTEAYAFALKAPKRHDGKFRMKKAKIRLANKHLFTYC